MLERGAVIETFTFDARPARPPVPRTSAPRLASCCHATLLPVCASLCLTRQTDRDKEFELMPRAGEFKNAVTEYLYPNSNHTVYVRFGNSTEDIIIIRLIVRNRANQMLFFNVVIFLKIPENYVLR